MLANLSLNSAVKICVAAPNILQFRFPDSHHITMECDAACLADILTWKTDASGPEWAEMLRASDLDLDDGIAEDIVQSLQNICVLIESANKTKTLGEAIFMHAHLLTKSAKSSFEVPTINKVSIVGDGVVGNIVSEIVTQMSLGQSRCAQESEYKIIVSDSPAFGSIREVYKSSGEAKFKSVAWMDEGSFRIGPLHIKGESACFECFLSRTEATAHFFEEAVSFNRGKRGNERSLEIGLMEKNLIRFSIERHLRLVVNGQFNIIDPGTVESWNLLSGENSTVPVLRNPYCDCGAASGRPTKAIRDII